MPLGGGKEADPPDTIVPPYPCPAVRSFDWMSPPSVFPPTLRSPFLLVVFCLPF
ncbi:hypothetical protein BDV32DRAFT_123547 [Aspergillus pseudonomiae]|nr:hypothetical protein BDV32DRAFT_123547 [Aspergillus pseudonomiae]